MSYTYNVTSATKGVAIIVTEVKSGKTKGFTLVTSSVETAEKFMQSLTDVQFKDMLKVV